MRNTFLIPVIAMMLLIGCKPKSSSTTDTKTDTSKSNHGLKMPDIGDLKTTTPTTTTTSGNWSKEYRNKFLQTCIGKASEKVSAADAFSYCSCMTEKVEAKYPNENEVDSKLTDSDIESMRPGCVTSNSNSTQSNPSTNQNNSNNSNNYNNSNNSNSGSWTASEQREFMDNCTPGASKSLGTSAATDYCDCMMKKLMQEYPNSADAGNVSKTHMSSLAADCLRK